MLEGAGDLVGAAFDEESSRKSVVAELVVLGGASREVGVVNAGDFASDRKGALVLSGRSVRGAQAGEGGLREERAPRSGNWLFDKALTMSSE